MYISQISQLKPSFRALYNQAELLLNSGKKIVVEVVEKKNRRSNEQNAYYWLFCEQLAEFFQEKEIMDVHEACGVKVEVPYTKDSIHKNLNKPLFGVETTTKMTVGEFCNYMNKLIIFWQDKTKGEFMMSELPANYLERKGYEIR